MSWPTAQKYMKDVASAPVRFGTPDALVHSRTGTDVVQPIALPGQKTFRDLVADAQPNLMQVAFKRTLSKVLAEDLVSRATVRMLECEHQFVPGTGRDDHEAPVPGQPAPRGAHRCHTKTVHESLIEFAALGRTP